MLHHLISHPPPVSVKISMRKNAKKFINLKCEHCNRLFEKELKEYNRRIKKDSESKFYCNSICSHKWLAQESSKRIDNFSKFRSLLYSSLRISKLKNYDFNLDLEFLESLWDKQGGKCSYSNIDMVLTKTSNMKNHTLFAASLDRINSSKGYTKDNVEFVCRFINLGKNGYSKEDTIKFIELIKNNGRLPEQQLERAVNALSYGATGMQVPHLPPLLWL